LLQIRIALKDWPEVQSFQQDLIDSQHYDAAYIFRTLRRARAFHFTAMPKLVSYFVNNLPFLIKYLQLLMAGSPAALVCLTLF